MRNAVLDGDRGERAYLMMEFIVVEAVPELILRLSFSLCPSSCVFNVESFGWVAFSFLFLLFIITLVFLYKPIHKNSFSHPRLTSPTQISSTPVNSSFRVKERESLCRPTSLFTRVLASFSSVSPLYQPCQLHSVHIIHVFRP